MQIENLVDRILSELGLTIKDTLSKSSSVLCIDAIFALILEDTIKDASVLLEVSESSLEHLLRRHFSGYCGKTSKTKWSIFLLGLVRYKRCTSCKEILPYEEYSIKSETYSGVSPLCRVCDNKKSKAYRDSNLDKCRARSKVHYYSNKSDYLARNANRKATLLKATPSWADLEKIKEIYRVCPAGYHVDHIVPLQGANVCGLHVEDNLQHLSALENMQKHNKFTGE